MTPHRPTQDRGRVTIPDIVLAAAALSILSILSQVFYPVLRTQTANGTLDAPVSLLFQATVPALIVAMLVVIYQIAVTGGGW